MHGEITETMVKRLRPRQRTYEVTCARLPGFAIRVLPSGKKVFLVRLRIDDRDRRQRIGPHGPELSTDEARRRAMIILAEPENAIEPSPRARPETSQPKLARRRAPPTRTREPLQEGPSHTHPAPPRTVAPTDKPADTPTVRELAERFLREHVDVYLKPLTRKNYRSVLERHILPEFGDRPFDAVTRSDVRAFHARIYDQSSTAEYVLSVLGSLYSRIIDDWELADMRNPTAGIKRRPSRRVDRFLSPEERRAVMEVLRRGLARPHGNKGALHPSTVWAIKLLMFTGQRRGEILTLTWKMVDWQHRCIHFPDTKTGQRSTPISSQAIALLREIHEATGRPRSGLVCPGTTGGPLAAINVSWNRIRDEAGCPDVRLHDLRHSFASDALMAGVPLAIVGEMLGHKQPRTTKRYAHLSDSVVRDALETTALRISAACEPTTSTATSTASGRAQEAAFTPISDLEWETIAVKIEAHKPRGGKPVDLRRIVDGIRWVLKNDAKWADVPARFGKPTTCWRWYKRWIDAGLVGSAGFHWLEER